MDETDKKKIVDNETPAPDPFDAASLRLPPAFEKQASVRKVLSTVPVRKPHSQQWIRVNSDPEYCGNFGVIELKDESEWYLLAPALIPDFENEMVRVRIFVAMSANKNVFLWPCKLPGTGHRSADSWYSSALEAAEAAMLRKVRIQANKDISAYEWSYSDSPVPEIEPVWPDVSFSELIRLGFAKPGRFIADRNHPVLKQLLEG